VSEARDLEFPLGRVVLTSSVAEAVDRVTLVTALRRHASGDWGDVSDMDKLANDLALVDATRIVSAYKSPEGRVFWVYTEADRSQTTLLFPEEY
jgi:hypothetical protein